jgi:dolichol-phosphate mannosyltransferase
MRGMISFVGFKQTPLLFDRDERFAGETNYPFKKMFRLAMDGILGFSTVPLRLMTYIGLVVSFFSFIGILYAVGMYVFFPQITVPGWTLMMTAILFIGGIQMVMLGVLGEYIGRIYSEVQGRPLYIIDEVIGN